jgi:hypothetical protein
MTPTQRGFAKAKKKPAAFRPPGFAVKAPQN